MPQRDRSAGHVLTRRGDVDRLLHRLTRFGVKLGLERITELLARQGNPHNRYPTVHVAGTNGKGSTACFLSALFSATGQVCGRYTSPHLHDFSERICIDGVPISDEELAALTRSVLGDALDRADPDAPLPTFFEAATALALTHFANRKVDMAIIEVGLGGRLDATNVVQPQVTVITPVALDHSQQLGNSVAQVAGEKAGIIKAGVPVVTGATDEALTMIKARAAALGCPLYVLGQDFEVVGEGPFSYHGIRTNYHDLVSGLPGTHQRHNAALALAAAELCFPKGVSLPAELVQQALLGAVWPGRLEQVQDSPPVVLDCAHNPDAARTLADYLSTGPHPGPLWLVLGVLQDKDFDGVVAPLAPLASRLVLTAPACDRQGKLAEQQQIASQYGPVQVANTVAEALALALDGARTDHGWVVVAGSLYTVGEARALLLAPTG